MAVDLQPGPQAPPDHLVKRTARVAVSVVNTIRVPHDRYKDETAAWFQTGSSMPAVVHDSQVKYFVDANAAFEEMVAAIRTANQPGHFIYMVNWFCDVDFNLLVNDNAINLRTLLTGASGQGVKIRALLWKGIIGMSQNEDAVHFLNSVKMQMTAQGPQWIPVDNPLKDAAAIWDARGNQNIGTVPFIGILPKHAGSQHQKFLCVFGEQGLVCFCGGIDFNPDRVTQFDKKGNQVTEHGAPLHDVHCRIIGPAAMELVNLFVKKWNDHSASAHINAKKGAPIVPPVPGKAGEQIVQVGRTLNRDAYKFAPGGERTGAALIAHAIANAKRFIYTEDQYFVGSPELLSALSTALGRIEHFTALVTYFRLTDLPECQFHRSLFIKRLKAVGGSKVRIFALWPPDAPAKAFKDGKVPHTYVHAKTWIVDDEFAVIGTLNSNRRSWSHDSEVCAGIYETSTDQVLHYRMAHWLRMNLWQEHLNMMSLPGSSAELADGVASGVHWLKPPPGARVRPYDENEDAWGANEHNLLWDEFADPD